MLGLDMLNASARAIRHPDSPHHPFSFFRLPFFVYTCSFPSAMFQITPQLFEKIKHFARFPQTGVSLRQMVMFGNAFPSLRGVCVLHGEHVANLPR